MATPIPVRERTRHDIVQQALRLFADKGYQATSLQDIATATGCSKAAVLYHFPGKAAVFAAAIEPAVQRLASLVAELRGLPAPDRPAAAIRRLVDMAVSSREILIVLTELLPVLHDFPELADLTREGMQLPQLLGNGADPDGEALSLFALGGLNAFCHHARSLDDETMRRVLETALHRLLLPPPA